MGRATNVRDRLIAWDHPDAWRTGVPRMRLDVSVSVDILRPVLTHTFFARHVNVSDSAVEASALRCLQLPSEVRCHECVHSIAEAR